jgi:hypothetical protein
MVNFVRNLFGGSKEKAAQDFITTLMGQLVQPYQAAIAEYANSKPEYVLTQGQGATLVTDLSPAGVDYLAAHLPTTFGAVFRGKDQSMLEFAFQMLKGLSKEKPAGSGGTGMLNPTLISLTEKVLGREVKRRTGLHR